MSLDQLTSAYEKWKAARSAWIDHGGREATYRAQRAEVNLAAALDTAWPELARLRELVSRLPVTADGVPVVPGMKLYPPCGHKPFVVSKSFDRHTCDEGKCRREEWGENDYYDVTYKQYDVERCYSTQAAAEAARDAGTNNAADAPQKG